MIKGKIIIWGLPSLNADIKDKKGIIIAAVHDHEGVIFRITWSADQSRIISVSDDRTVRLWSLTTG